MGRGFGKRRPKGPTPRHNALRPMPVTMPPRARRRSPFDLEHGQGALDRAPAATAAPSTAAPCPALSTPCVTVVLSTPAHHNYPAARFPEARVAASCTHLRIAYNFRVMEFPYITRSTPWPRPALRARAARSGAAVARSTVRGLTRSRTISSMGGVEPL
jgi:hypothetical protein